MFHFSPRKGGQVKGQMDLHRCGGHLTVEGVPNKRLWRFYGPRGGNGLGGGERKELEVEKY